MEEIASKPPAKRKGNPNWVKGVSGNPAGRKPSALDLGCIVREFLAEKDLNRGDGGNKLRTVIERVAKDDPRTLLNYGYGKPLDTVQLQGPDGQPLNPLAGLTVVIEGASAPEKKE